MATVSRFRLNSMSIQPGQTTTTVWNNTPREIVCVIDCMPFASGSDAQIEVVRTWNERRVGGINAERRFFFQLRNIGSSPSIVDVYMAQID